MSQDRETGIFIRAMIPGEGWASVDIGDSRLTDVALAGFLMTKEPGWTAAAIAIVAERESTQRALSEDQEKAIDILLQLLGRKTLN